jgi:ubiquinone/menaquinone biosynthesis C-methylase UbiE
MKFLLIYFANFSTDGGLVTQPKVMEYLATLKEPAQILEVGCGTGAGANEITKVHPTAEVTALDMQKAAIQTCKRLHADGNPRLTCIHGNGMETGFPSNKYDIIVVSETHIAAEDLDPETKRILKEIERMLKPGGFFVWGNALPTRVWVAAEQYFKSDETDMQLTEFTNVTVNAVNARVEDEPRVNAFCNNMFDRFPITHVMPQCRHVLDRMVKNFYRHPGTNLFKTMVTGYDSYVHMSASKPLKP